MTELWTVALDPNGCPIWSEKFKQYHVSSLGKVRLDGSTKDRRICWKNGNPEIAIGKRHFDLKNMIWRSFNGTFPESERIVFADGDRFNCVLDNLIKIKLFRLQNEPESEEDKPIKIKCVETGMVFVSIGKGSKVFKQTKKDRENDEASKWHFMKIED